MVFANPFHSKEGSKTFDRDGEDHAVPMHSKQPNHITRIIRPAWSAIKTYQNLIKASNNILGSAITSKILWYLFII